MLEKNIVVYVCNWVVQSVAFGVSFLQSQNSIDFLVFYIRNDVKLA